MQQVREPAVAGMFYPNAENKLRDQIEIFLDIASAEDRYDNVFGLIAPHAGYIYSGKTAAYGYHAVSGKEYKSAIVLSPSHREYFPGISVYDGAAYKTPLGIVEVDNELREKFIGESKTIFKGLNGHKAEHALEVQLPFLQYLYPKIKILPIVIGDQSKLYVDELADRLSQTVNNDTLIVASSDLSHFYSKPQADEFDSRVANRIELFQFDELQKDLEEQNAHACGGGNIVALMKAASLLGRTKSKITHRSDSGDTTGDNSEVVGYLSAIIF